MKILIYIIIISIPFQVFADEGWQNYLEANTTIDHIITFEDYDDWTPSGVSNGINYSPSLQPTKDSGNPSEIVGFQYWSTTSPDGSQVWIGDHGSDYTLRDKSLIMTFQNIGQYDQYGPSGPLFYIGTNPGQSGTRNDGYESFYIFYAFKMQRSHFNIIGSGYSWEPTGVNNEYYLLYNSGDPGLLMPNTLIINGLHIQDPCTVVSTFPISSYPTRDDLIGSLSGNQWAYGDPISLGFETLVVHLSDLSDPDTKANDYIQYDTGSIVMDSATTSTGVGVWKWSFATRGFWRDPNSSPYLRYYDGSWSNYCGANGAQATFYGINFNIYNLRTDEGAGELYIGQPGTWASIATYNSGDDCYTYEDAQASGGNFGSGQFTFIPTYYMQDQWVYVQQYYDTGTCGSTDGAVAVWYYDESGSLIASDTISNIQTCNDPNPTDEDHNNPYNQFHFGGNRLGTSYNYDETDSWDNRHYFDDIMFDDQPIASTYFAALAAYTSTSPIVTAPSNQTISGTSWVVSGASATIETGRTVSSCTWSSDQGPSGSLNTSGTAPNITISGTISGLTQGESNIDHIITISLTDSEAESGSDNFTITVEGTGGGPVQTTVLKGISSSTKGISIR